MAEYRPKPADPNAGLHIFTANPDALLVAENGTSTFVTLRDIRRPGPLDLTQLTPYQPARPVCPN
ncbi:unannotated protein [freshwater metagenome]|uniref:Unannotated protein n=1 Tax=freshwater metagenome TaxID=449393 RepID=A0A6J7GEV7_9ZZZZ|nr:hypothetical protein [Actinomycetota bacterium]